MGSILNDFTKRNLTGGRKWFALLATGITGGVNGMVTLCVYGIISLGLVLDNISSYWHRN